MYRLREYQERGIERVRGALRRGRRAPLICLATGGGKTVVASHIIQSADQKGTRTLFLAHREELIVQCSNKLTENGVGHGIIKAGFDPDPFRRVQVASVQSYNARAGRLEHGYGLIFIDECHRAAAASYRRIIELNPGAIVVGLTATPYRSDGQGLGDIFDELIEMGDTQMLTDLGYLVPSRVHVGQKVHGLDKLHIQGGDYKEDELADLMNRPKLVGNAVAAWLKLAWGRKTLAFCVNRAHARAVCDEFVAHGVKAEYLDGETKPEERRAMIERLATGDTQIIVNCGVLTEGFDCPVVSCIIYLRPTKSRNLWRQIGGRGLRLCDGKADCLILDHANVTAIHGFLTDPDSISLTEGLKRVEAKVKYKCKSCGAVLASRPRICPACGFQPVAQGQQLELSFGGQDDGYEMIEVAPPPEPVKREWKQSDADTLFLIDLARLHKTGKGPGQAYVFYKNRTGRWPSGELTAKSRHAIKYAQVDGKRKMVWA
jgi:DNA repair protein RadD